MDQPFNSRVLKRNMTLHGNKLVGVIKAEQAAGRFQIEHLIPEVGEVGTFCTV